MKNVLFLAALFLVSCNSSKSTNTTEKNDFTTFYFIRHAEKRTDQGSDPELTDAGKERAAQWINFFFLQDVDAVLSSDYKRTRATAQPLATSKKMDVTIYDVKTLTGKELLEKYRGKTVAIFGHSNTINTYANQLQTDSIYANLNDADYDHYFKVMIDANGKRSAFFEPMIVVEN